MEKIIDNEKEDREMLMKGQLQMAALFGEVLKAKDSSGSFELVLHLQYCLFFRI